MNCINCSAPLSAHTDTCEYCGTRNDTDLRRLYDASVTADELSDRYCPRCRVELRRIRVDLDQVFELERCDKCLGLFFDPGELESVLRAAVTAPPGVDNERLNILLEKESQDDEWPCVYLSCPACGELMLRKAYGARSGVIADWCKKHGMWLDGGELGKLLRWARAGGFEKTEKVERARQLHEEACQRQREALAPPSESMAGDRPLFPTSRSTASRPGLIEALAEIFTGWD